MNRIRLTRGTIAVAAASLALGFGIITQIKQREDNPFASMRQDDLVRYLDELTSRNEELHAEEQELRSQLESLQAGADSDAAAQAAAKEQARIHGILAGTLPATGPGVRVKIADPQNALTSPVLVTLIEELRNAGAEAIQINDIRITATAWVKREGATLLLNGQRITSPFTIQAIGNSETLSVALAIPGGATAQVRALNATMNVEELSELTIDAVVEAPAPVYATLAPRDGKPT